MCKNNKHQGQKPMSDLQTVEDATMWSNYLTNRQYKGVGDTLEAAMSRVSKRCRVPFHTLWNLRYRSPNDIWAKTYLRLKNAYDDECFRQENKLRREVENMRRTMGDAAINDPVVVALDSALKAMEEEAAR